MDSSPKFLRGRVITFWRGRQNLHRFFTMSVNQSVCAIFQASSVYQRDIIIIIIDICKIKQNTIMIN